MSAASNALTAAKRRVVLAKAHFRLKAGRSSKVKVRLTKAGLRALRKKRLIVARATTVAKDGFGRKVKKTAKLRVKARPK